MVIKTTDNNFKSLNKKLGHEMLYENVERIKYICKHLSTNLTSKQIYIYIRLSINFQVQKRIIIKVLTLHIHISSLDDFDNSAISQPLLLDKFSTMLTQPRESISHRIGTVVRQNTC